MPLHTKHRCDQNAESSIFYCVLQRQYWVNRSLWNRWLKFSCVEKAKRIKNKCNVNISGRFNFSLNVTGLIYTSRHWFTLINTFNNFFIVNLSWITNSTLFGSLLSKKRLIFNCNVFYCINSIWIQNLWCRVIFIQSDTCNYGILFYFILFYFLILFCF